ncbi:hypothetical protein G6O69_05025 [Pseudenhygromyxa sp. WMMC2535]|uniref:hypothetical protein n=1 Tax=Pseudenhygromyxa sp. WMMC2535 TaxID=2712867 RepID=UPI0015548EE6|nr:hypothetical protein [Pseudenhygromyxa sp. WMMC2535]NVB37183.1 hypothetical protein [Pseudenhygromyxa sp. WMMC2535]
MVEGTNHRLARSSMGLATLGLAGAVACHPSESPAPQASPPTKPVAGLADSARLRARLGLAASDPELPQLRAEPRDGHLELLVDGRSLTTLEGEGAACSLLSNSTPWLTFEGSQAIALVIGERPAFVGVELASERLRCWELDSPPPPTFDGPPAREIESDESSSALEIGPQATGAQPATVELAWFEDELALNWAPAGSAASRWSTPTASRRARACLRSKPKVAWP